MGKKELLESARTKIRQNLRAGIEPYKTGLTQDEEDAYQRALMFGDNDEAFPEEWEWSRIVD